MNSSVYSADRATHMRIVVAALIASIGMILFALAARADRGDAYAAVVRIHPNHQVELSGPPMPPSAARRI